jgi:hypothetical protein
MQMLEQLGLFREEEAAAAQTEVSQPCNTRN